MNRWAINGFFVVLAILAGSTAYFATKASVLQEHLTRKTNLFPTATSPQTIISSSSLATSVAPTISPVPTATVNVVSSPIAIPTAGAGTDHLSQPSETYTVAAGDTLYPISLKSNMTLERLAEANGLVDPYRLTIGQILAIPEVNAKQHVFEVRFTTDPARASQIQTRVTGGADAWRLEPKEVAKTESANVFGLTVNDDYRETSRDETLGTAVVTVSRLIGNQTKTYTVNLIQPATKGKIGVWAIVKINPKAA